MQSFSITTLGCKVNHSESMAIKGAMIEAGYTYVDKGIADIEIINTCTVTHVAASKSRQSIRKKISKNPDSLVVVVGCYSQVSPEEVEAIDGVDIVVGNSDKLNLPSMIEEHFVSKTKNYFVPSEKIISYQDISTNPSYERTRAFVKIQDGCNNFCTYCIIPYARGRIRSRGLDSILSEVAFLEEEGFKEIVLTGIHMASYGLDRSNNDVKGLRLIDVIESVAESFPDMRIRLGSLEPKVVSEDFAERLSKISELCDSFHLSLQSGSDKILKSMKRRYRTLEYTRAVGRLRKYFKNPAISSDVIVGFPGEDIEDFEETKAFCESIGFATLHVFPYSKREGTPAAEFGLQVDGNDKKNRVISLRESADLMKRDYLNSNIGTKARVLIEKKYDDVIFGHSKNYLPVFVKGEGISEVQENEIVDCNIVRITKKGVEGVLV